MQRLAQVGGRIRAAVVDQPFPADLEADIRTAYDRLVAGGDEEGPSRCGPRRRRTCRMRHSPVSRRRLNIRGIDAILVAIRQVFASLFNDRRSPTVHHGFAHEQVALSAGVQQMVRSDVGASG